MSKRTKKDIKITSAEQGAPQGDSGRLSADQSPSANSSVEPAAGKKKPVKRASKAALLEPTGKLDLNSQLESNAKLDSSNKLDSKSTLEHDLSGHDDPELQSLLLQVDHMLTEMTKSKWLSSDWPSLEIDLGNNKK